eukprot:c67_g1_i1.p1 GENE.c67_g1_i1~~c67_g1_i1.p1  ORF type:complete len:268 (-),score=54.13 c67_g1_i1:294-1097(-)
MTLDIKICPVPNCAFKCPMLDEQGWHKHLRESPPHHTAVLVRLAHPHSMPSPPLSPSSPTKDVDTLKYELTGVRRQIVAQRRIANEELSRTSMLRGDLDSRDRIISRLTEETDIMRWKFGKDTVKREAQVRRVKVGALGLVAVVMCVALAAYMDAQLRLVQSETWLQECCDVLQIGSHSSNGNSHSHASNKNNNLGRNDNEYSLDDEDAFDGFDGVQTLQRKDEHGHKISDGEKGNRKSATTTHTKLQAGALSVCDIFQRTKGITKK